MWRLVFVFASGNLAVMAWKRGGLLSLVAVGALLVACGDDDIKSSDDDGSGAGASGGSDAGGAGAGGDSGSGGGDSGVCARWRADRMDLDEGSWSGDLMACQAGDIAADSRDNALRLTNLYRWLADLPPVVTDATRDQKAQACALIMHANEQLSHNVDSSWTCFSDDGSEAAGKSNIATTPGVRGVDLYMVDPGNDTTLGHRRWILSNSLGPIGLGSTSDYSCMWTLGGSNDAGREWIAFPPPGDVPLELMNPFTWTSVDETGWSVQSDDIDLSNAAVSVTDDGTDMPVTVTVLQNGYGSTHAISFIPQGWTSEAGHTYRVSVTGITPTIEYDVSIADCSM